MIGDHKRSSNEAKQVIEQLDEERHRLQVLLDTIPAGILITDANGRFLRTNGIFDEIWGGKAPPVESFKDYGGFQAWWSDTGISLRPEDWGVYRAIKMGRTIIGDVIDVRRLNGEIGTIVISSSPIRDNEGNITGAICAGQDISSQRRLEQIAAGALERNQLYIDILSHDINNLNAATMGYLQLLGDRDLDEKECAWIASAQRSVNEVTRLIETMNRIQIIGSEGETQTYDLGKVLGRIKEEAQEISDRDISIILSGTGDNEIMATEIVNDIFTSLIGNAIIHSTGPVEIHVTVGTVYKRGSKMKSVGIEDNGPGIPDEMKGNIFSRMKRGATKGVGSGLGLFLVHRLVEGMQGEIWVEDRVPGDHAKGARFVVLLPAASPLERTL